MHRSSWSNSNNWARVSESSAVMQAGAMANSAHESWLTGGSGESEGGDHIGRVGERCPGKEWLVSKGSYCCDETP